MSDDTNVAGPEPAAPAGPPGSPGAAPAAAAEPAAGVPTAVVARRNRLNLSLVWIVPIVAALVGLVLVVRALLAGGPEITIEFRSAEGLEAGRTEVRFKEVAVGRVKQVTLTPDRQRVLVRLSLVKSAAGLAVDDTRFWVVRPRIGSGGVSGLSTLLSGSYIGVDAGESTESRSEFTGLDTPPLVLRGEPGRNFVLRADDLGSLDIGSPVYHRRVRVGRVVGYALDDAGRTLLVKVFVEAPHERLVTPRTRFWNASGVDFSLTGAGLTVHTQSLASVLAGGVAFAEAPSDAPPEAPPVLAQPGQLFQLHASEREAMAGDDGDATRVRMVFRQQSLRGLEPGAPVELLGVPLGVVRSVELQPEGAALALVVAADMYPRRLGRLRDQLVRPGSDPARADRLLLKQLVDRGLRAQARTANLLTGQLYVALEFTPPGKGGAAPKVAFDASAPVPLLPTVGGTLSELQPRLMDVADRLSRIRFDEIGSELQAALASLRGSSQSLQGTLASAETMIRQLTPQAQDALAGVQKTLVEVQKTLADAQGTMRNADRSLADPDGTLQRNANQALGEVQRAAQALRVLADYLQRHPESLLRGKPPDVLEKPR